MNVELIFNIALGIIIARGIIQVTNTLFEPIWKQLVICYKVGKSQSESL
jgi:hypothetical protein